MIGFFDSGLGGLSVLKEVVKLLPQYSTIYLGDNARAPYGDLDEETIYEYTTDGVSELFNQGAELIILACNTSSSVALRRIQQEFLVENFPEKNVLGIVIPTAEEIGKITQSRKVGVLGTKATANSLAYTKEIKKVYPELEVYEQACPSLVLLIEDGEIDSQEMHDSIEIYLDELLTQSINIDSLILGCTHFALIESQIKRKLPDGIQAVSQGPIIARHLQDYLRRHPEREENLNKEGNHQFFTSEDSKKIESLAKLFYGSPFELETIKIRAGV